MKWNIEWIDLQNIERMIAECWRMNDKQIEQYYRKLLYRRDLEFAGALGAAFLELMPGIISREADYDWSKLQKDVHMLQKLIQEGLDKDDKFWKQQYLEIVDEPSFYFYTKLGKAFTDQLAEKLELNITKEQKLLYKDIQMIEKICAVCDFKKEADVQKAIHILTKNDNQYFSSWLGESFVKTLREQFIKKEEPLPVELPIPEEPKPKARSRRRFPKKLKSLFFCIPLVCLGIWVYTTMKNDQMHSYLKQFRSKVQSVTTERITRTDRVNAADKEKGNRGSDETGTGTSAGTSVGTSIEKKLNQNLNNEKVHEPDHTVEVDINTVDADDKQGGKNAQEMVEAENISYNAAAGDTQADAIEVPDILPKYQSFYEAYPDLFGWLKIPGTEIDVPVLQSDDEEKGEKYYYLHRDYMGRESEEGSLFVDSRSSCYPQDQNTVIYGHNMSNGRIFGTLDRFTDYDFLNQHRDIQYDTIYEPGTYRIAAVLKTRILYQDEEGFRYYRFFNYDTEEQFQECIAFINRNQLFDTGTKLRYGDRMLMLSTCEYSQENGRLVVVAKKID